MTCVSDATALIRRPIWETDSKEDGFGENDKRDIMRQYFTRHAQISYRMLGDDKPEQKDTFHKG